MRRSRSRGVLAGFALALPLSALAQTAPGTRWGVTGSAIPDFQITVDAAVAHTGRLSLRVAAEEEPAGFAGVITTMPAAPYAGHRVRVSTFLRTSSLEGQGAALWARADTAVMGSVAFATTQGRRYLGGTMEWTSVTVDLDVPASSRTIVLGVLSTARGLDNLIAFARLTGYVRFFHPSDAALTTNWDEFTVRGMRVVERAPTADSLAATLRALFAPIAPAVAVYRTGTRPSLPATQGDGGALGVLFWQHVGFGVRAGMPGAQPNSVYRSVRRRVAAPDRRLPASVPVDAYAPGCTMPVPDPAFPFVADLGGGVSAAVPLALYTTAPAADSLWHPPPAAEHFSTADRATRLAAVALLWMVPQHFYPYFDVVRTDWPGALRRGLDESAVDNVSVRAVYRNSPPRSIVILFALYRKFA